MAKVSVIVCVYNDESYIGACIESLLRQTYPKDQYEIIVVDDGSTDGTAQIVNQIVRSYSIVAYIYQENKGPSRARNRGIEMATGEFVAFIDSDCEAVPDWLERLIGCFAEGVASVGGMQFGHPQDNEFAKKVDAFLRAVGIIGDYVKPHRELREVSHNASCNSSYRASLIREVGGFRDGLFPGEDVDLDRRLRDKGYKILFTPHAVVYHHRPDNRQKWHRMLLRYGQSSADNLILHGPFRLIQIIPILLPIMVIMFSLFTVISPLLTTLSTVLITAGVIFWVKVRSSLSIKDTIVFSTETILIFCKGFWWRMFHKIGKPVV